MARETECEHNIDFYRVVAGSGLSVTEQCSECGAQIHSLSPKEQLEQEIKEEKAEERKKRRTVNKRKRTIAAKKQAEEDEEDEDDNIFEKAKYKVEDLFD